MIGFIGLGVMGEPMCRNLATKSGEKVLGYDVDAAPLERLRGAGVEAAGSVREIAERCHMVFLSLPGVAEVKAVCAGPASLMLHQRAGTYIIDLSTVTVALARDLNSRFAARGIKVCNGMGMTETGPTVFLMDTAHAEAKIGSVGKPCLHLEVAIHDDDGRGQPLDPDHAGPARSDDVQLAGQPGAARPAPKTARRARRLSPPTRPAEAGAARKAGVPPPLRHRRPDPLGGSETPQA